MQFLIIGLGSIGKRHLNNIIGLGYKDISVVTSKKHTEVEYNFITKYDSLDDALSEEDFDVAVLCTPTAYHAPDIIKLLRAQVKNIYIEKPVSHNLEQIEEITKLASSNHNKIVVGYDLHFDPGFLKVQQLLKNKEIGKLISVNAAVGQYLPDWRPHEDYRKGMSAQIKTGGGVLLDLVHEFDYLYSLFNKAEHIGCFFNNSGTLEIETEDVAEVIIKFKNGVLGSIHLDYFQRKLIRNCRITGSDGTVFWDIAESKVSWHNGSSESEFVYSDFKRNDRFISILKAFLSEDKDERLTSFEAGIESLKMVIAAKEASLKNKIVHLN